MLYLVRHPRWHGGEVAVCAGPGQDWESFARVGTVATQVGDLMVEAGIAVWDEPGG